MPDQPTTPAVRDLDELRRQVTAVMTALGDTHQQVAASLHAHRRYGRICHTGACPLAVHLLASNLGLRFVHVVGDVVQVQYGDHDDDVMLIATPAPVEEFIAGFDGGQHPELDIDRHAAVMDDLIRKVLARFAVELREADTDLQLVHLAQRAEARYASNLGDRMRALVDEERARRVFTAGIVGAR